MDVDVLDYQCATRTCFWLGFDKGTFSPGRGYTSYHKKERPVCFTRHLHGCPHTGVCIYCCRAYVEDERYCRSCHNRIIRHGMVNDGAGVVPGWEGDRQ